MSSRWSQPHDLSARVRSETDPMHGLLANARLAVIPAQAGIHSFHFARRLALWVFACFAAALNATHVHAQAASDALWLQQARQFTLAAARHGQPGRRVEVELGALDARLRLAPCQRATPYLPDAARLWGRTRVGLRCVQGASAWNIFVPVTVKVFAPATVATAALPAGHALVPADLAQAEVDLAEEGSGAVADPAAAIGRTLLRPLPAGAALRQSHLKARQWFIAGEEVKIIARGTGFSAVGVGQALTAGIEGQPARVRTESGRILVGQPVAQGAVDLNL